MTKRRPETEQTPDPELGTEQLADLDITSELGRTIKGGKPLIPDGDR